MRGVRLLLPGNVFFLFFRFGFRCWGGGLPAILRGGHDDPTLCKVNIHISFGINSQQDDENNERSHKNDGQRPEFIKILNFRGQEKWASLTSAYIFLNREPQTK